MTLVKMCLAGAPLPESEILIKCWHRCDCTGQQNVDSRQDLGIGDCLLNHLAPSYYRRHKVLDLRFEGLGGKNAKRMTTYASNVRDS